MNKTLDLDKIREEIKASGYKVKYLAEKIGVTPPTLSSFLTGKRNMGASAQILLLQVLNLDTETLKKRAS